jgi:uncharacterized protein involved in exopolysaccharide biosynthesis
MPDKSDETTPTAARRAETLMTAAEFWCVLARNAKTGAVIFIVCVLGAVLLGVTSPPRYKAVALFQIQVPSVYRTSDIPSLDVSVLQAWLGQVGVLARIIDSAGLRGRLTTGQVQASIGVTAAGGANTFETAATSFSQDRAQRLANAAANVLSARAVEVIQAELPSMADGVQELIGRARALVAAERDAARRTNAPDALAPLRYQAASTVYRDLQARLMLLHLLGAPGAVRARLVIPAGVPNAPVSPGRSLYILFGVVAGVIFGVTGALVNEAVRGPRG